MSPAKRFWSLFLTGLVVLQPMVLTGCISRTPDKRILQYLNREGFGKRYAGNVEEENYVTIEDTFSWADRFKPELRGTARVDIDGTIQLPEAGTVFVAGFTRSELESYLTQSLSPYWDEVDIQVELAPGANRRYFVVGAVANELR